MLLLGHMSPLNGHSHHILSVAFSPNGWSLVSGLVDGAVRLWSTTGASIATLKGHLSGVREVAFSLDGSRFASRSNDGTVKLWDGSTGAHIAILQGHSRPVELVIFRQIALVLLPGRTMGQ